MTASMPSGVGAPGGGAGPSAHRHDDGEGDGVLESIHCSAVVCLPASCVAWSGIVPNCDDRGRLKDLWVGRLCELQVELRRAAAARRADPAALRERALLASLAATQEKSVHASESWADLARMSDSALVRMSAAVARIEHCWARYQGRRRGHRTLRTALDVFQDAPYTALAVLASGSLGVGGDSLRVCRMLAGMGVLVVAPDDMAESGSRAGYRWRQSTEAAAAARDVSDYWSNNLLYKPEAPTVGSLAYKSNADEYAARGERWWADLYSKVIDTRCAELGCTLRHLPPWAKHRGVFLAGVSEGAIALGAFDDRAFPGMVRGRVTFGATFERNFWTYGRGLEGIRGDPTAPTLCFMGDKDEYFARDGSVAANVAAASQPDACHTPITGSPLGALRQCITGPALCAMLEGALHSTSLTHDRCMRAILGEFVRRPEAIDRLDELWAAKGRPACLVAGVDVKEVSRQGPRLLHALLRPSAVEADATTPEAESDRRRRVEEITVQLYGPGGAKASYP